MKKTKIILAIVGILLIGTVTSCERTPEESADEEVSGKDTNQDSSVQLKPASDAFVAQAADRRGTAIDFFEEKEVAKRRTLPQQVAAVPPTSLVTYSGGAFQVGDFSIGLCSINREEHIANLNFVITKTRQTTFPYRPIKVVVTDDHNNTYAGEFHILPFVSLRAGLLPIGFTYVKTVKISMPKLAPLHTIRLEGTEEVSFSNLKLVKPALKSEFGEATAKTGTEAKVARFLSLTIDGFLPSLDTWTFSLTLENKDYNALRSIVWCAIQLKDGTILPEKTTMQTTVDGLSRKTFQKPFETLKNRAASEVRMIILLWQGVPSHEALKLWPVSAEEFPPRVGQGVDGEGEVLFIEAYRQNGGRELLGDPIGPVHWHIGGEQANDEHDLLIQELEAASGVGKSIIVWDKQRDASTAYVLYGDDLKRFSDLGTRLMLLHIELPIPNKFFSVPYNSSIPNLERPLDRPRPPLFVPLVTSNVALHKPVTSSDENPRTGKLSMITDGDKDPGSGHYVELGPFLQYITIDLGKVYELHAIVIWHYPMHSVYFDVVAQICTNNFITDIKTVFNNDIDNSASLGIGTDMHYVETNEGKLIDLGGIKGRYVRLYSNCNTHNDLTHYTEVEVYGRPLMEERKRAEQE